MMYLLICLFNKYNDRVPTYEEIEDYAEAGLYGDDKIASVDWNSFTHSDFVEDEFTEFVTSIYGEFGLEVKKSAFMIDFDPFCGPLSTHLEFLGSSAFYNDELGLYWPEPRIGKIATSLRGILDSEDDEEVLVSKMSAAFELCFFSLTDECKFLIQFLKEFSKYLLDNSLVEDQHNINILIGLMNNTHPVGNIIYGWE